MALVAYRFEVFLVSLDPTQGGEIKKTRPCVLISPDEMNHHIQTVIVAPLTTKGRDYPTRVPITFRRKRGQVVLEQIRTVDKTCLIKRLGKINKTAIERILNVLQEMFAL